jgi:nitrogen fixation protein FixH
MELSGLFIQELTQDIFSTFLSRRRDEAMSKARRLLLILLTMVLFLLVFACQYQRQHAAQEFTQAQNGITAVFSMSPDSPTAMESVTLLLKLTDVSGKAIESAQVAYDLTMPGMTMPPNQPQVTDKGGGVYQADTTFTMSGNWHVEAAVTYNGTTTPFTFDFSVQ